MKDILTNGYNSNDDIPYVPPQDGDIEIFPEVNHLTGEVKILRYQWDDSIKEWLLLKEI